jgi:hypothetical protein
MFPPAAIINRFRKAVGPDNATAIVDRLRRVATSAGEEGLQEAASNIAQNLIAQGVYDPEQGTFTNTGESFGLGAGVGGLIAGLVELGIRDRGRATTDPVKDVLEGGEEELGLGEISPAVAEAAAPSQAPAAPTDTELTLDDILSEGAQARAARDADTFYPRSDLDREANRARGNIRELEDDLISDLTRVAPTPPEAPATLEPALDAELARGAQGQAQRDQEQARRDQEAQAAAVEPAPLAKNKVRVWHSGSVGEGDTGRWVSTDRTYASDYRRDLPLYYLDLEKTDPRVNNPDYPDEQGVDQGFTFNFELSPEEAARLTPVSRQQTAITVAEQAQRDQEQAQLRQDAERRQSISDIETEFAQSRQERERLASQGQGEQADMFRQAGQTAEAPPVTVDVPTLRALGVPPRAAVMKQIEGKDVNDPAQRQEVIGLLRNYVANPTVRDRNPQARRGVMGLITRLSEAPAAPVGVTPTQREMELQDTEAAVTPTGTATPTPTRVEGEDLTAETTVTPNTLDGNEVVELEASTGPRGYSIKPEEQRIERELSGKSFAQVAQWAVDNAPDSYQKEIAQRVQAKLLEFARAGVKLNFVLESGGRRSSSMFGARGKLGYVLTKDKPIELTLTLNGAAVMENQNGYPPGTRYETVLHELIHAATTVHILYLPKSLQAKALNDLRNKVVAHFNAKIKAGKKLSEFEQAIFSQRNNALLNTRELLSWGLTNKDMQAMLADIRVGDRSLFDRFVDIVRNILGLDRPYTSALEELIRTTDSLLDVSTAEIRQGVNEAGYMFGIFDPAPMPPEMVKVERAARAAIESGTSESAERFLKAQGETLFGRSVPIKSPKYKRAVASVMSTGGELARKVLTWGVPLPALNDYVKTFIRPKGEQYEPFADSVARFTKIVERMEGDTESFLAAITAQLGRMEEWRNANPDKIKTFRELYFGGRLDGVDVTKDISTYAGDAEKIANYKKLKKLYVDVGPGGQAIYRQMRTIHNRQFNELTQQVYDRVYSETQDKELATSLRNSFTKQMEEKGPLEGYASFVRTNGIYMLKYPIEGSEQPGFEIFDNLLDRESRRQQLIAEDGIKDADIKPFLASNISNFDGVVPSSFMGEIVSTLKEKNASPELVEAMMALGISMSPSSMVLQKLAKSRNVPGYNTDPFGAFQEGTVGLGRRLVNLKYGAQLTSEVRDMEATRKNVANDPVVLAFVEEMGKRAKYAANPAHTQWSNLLTTATYGWTLGFNVSSSVVDFTSIGLITVPFLAKYPGYDYGIRNSYKASMVAMKDIMGMGTSADVESLTTAGLEGQELADALATLDADERDLVGRKTMPSMLNINFDDPVQAKKYGYLQPLVKEIRAAGHSERYSELAETAEFGEGNILSEWSSKMGFMLRASERFKREVGLKAAYDLELKRLAPNGNPTPENLQAAAQKAMDMSLLLNGGSSAISGSGFQRGNLSRVMFMYRRFAAGQLYFQAKVAYMSVMDADPDTRKAMLRFFAYNMLTSTAFVGIKGAPMMGAVAVLFGMFQAVFGDDDEDNSFEGFLRSSLDPLLVEGVPNVLLNANVGSRMELSNLLIRDTNLPDDANLAEIVAAHFGGPAFGSIDRAIRGYNLIQEGQVQRGVENMLPVALSNILKGGRFANEGAIETLRGDETVPVSYAGSLAQALGFAPADYARAMEFTTTQSRIDKRMQKKRSDLYEAIYAAHRMNDATTMARTMQAIIEFNRNYPNFRIESKDIRQSIKTRDRNTQNMIMGALPAARRQQDWIESADDWGF